MSAQCFISPIPLRKSSPTITIAPRINPRTPPKATAKKVTILDYGAGNVRSLENALRLLNYDIHWAETAADISAADKLIFPGVGSFGAAMQNLHSRNFVPSLQEYIRANRPFLGICLGLHTLFEGSEESPDCPGLGLFPGTVGRFHIGQTHNGIAVPHMGWNTVTPVRDSSLFRPSTSAMETADQRFYFVHSYRVGADILEGQPPFTLATTTHGETFLSVFQRGRICATQFHPEKSGPAGLRLLRNFLTAEEEDVNNNDQKTRISLAGGSTPHSGLAKRVVACLDVRENDSGDLVVTKGDQYDVRETDSKAVRNLGKPVELAKRYFEEGADEICFLNITSFRGQPVGSTAMIEVLERTSREVFVPLCIGGGIRDYTDANGKQYSALDVAAMYFRAGADKISLGSDAVYAAEEYRRRGADGRSSIERISHVYGAQAVVVSVDPRRVYVENDSDTRFTTVTHEDGRCCWYQCTVKGGREGRDIDVIELVKAVEELGAGEILLNSMDQDGQNEGFDCLLVDLVRKAVKIPVIASSGAGKVEHFTECFDRTGVEAALAAGIFHRREVSIDEVKTHMREHGTAVRVGGSLEEVVG